MNIDDIIRIPSHDGYYRVEFINYARAYVVPLARQPRVIHTAQGEKTIQTAADGAGFNISPGSPVEVIAPEDLPADLRTRWLKKVA
jgi:hypothetical protein